MEVHSSLGNFVATPATYWSISCNVVSIKLSNNTCVTSHPNSTKRQRIQCQTQSSVTSCSLLEQGKALLLDRFAILNLLQLLHNLAFFSTELLGDGHADMHLRIGHGDLSIVQIVQL